MIDQHWTYKILRDLPRPPDWLINNIDNGYRPNIDKYSTDDEHYLSIKERADWKNQSYDWIQPMASNNNVRHYFEHNFVDWIKNNITSEFQFGNSGIMFFDEPQLPHTDVTRDFVLLFNLEAGGTNSELCFWQEKGKSLYRERMLAVDRSPNLKLIDQIKGPFDCWYLVNTRVIHSVENVEKLRLNLQISFDNEIPAEFLQRYF